MTLDNGDSIDANKSYRVAGWAVKIKRPNRVALKGVAGNPGIAEG